MALNYDLTKIADHENLYREAGTDSEGEQLHKLDATYESIIFYTITVGIGEITDKTAAEFYARVHLWEQLYGPIVSRVVDGNHEGCPITPADIARMKGLTTNVFPMESRAKFMGKIRSMLDDGVREYEREVGK